MGQADRAEGSGMSGFASPTVCPVCGRMLERVTYRLNAPVEYEPCRHTSLPIVQILSDPIRGVREVVVRHLPGGAT
jgi:hypothetical protein